MSINTALEKPCPHPEWCPWGVKPMTGMWAKVEGHEFWGTDCIVYRACPHPFKKKWVVGPKVIPIATN